jgi:monofunctional chorismate mutase
LRRAGKMELNLDEIRKQIDDTDRELVSVFCKRMDLVKQVAAYKIANDMPVLRPEREEAVLERVQAQAGAKYGEYARDLYGHVMRVSREMQQKMIDESR